MKRFYKLVAVAPVAVGYEIHLDRKPVLTPSRQTLCAPNRAVATAIAEEWEAQGDVIDPSTMPLMQILVTALDRVAPDRDAMERATLDYLDTDLLWYRTTLPVALAVQQAEAWDPWRNWVAQRSGAIPLVSTDLHALAQPDALHAYVKGALNSLNVLELTVAQLVTSVSGSAILGLAVALGEATPDDVFAATTVEERYKATLYNEAFYGAAPSQEKRDASVRRDLEAADRFLKLLKTS